MCLLANKPGESHFKQSNEHTVREPGNGVSTRAEINALIVLRFHLFSKYAQHAYILKM